MNPPIHHPPSSTIAPAPAGGGEGYLKLTVRGMTQDEANVARWCWFNFGHWARELADDRLKTVILAAAAERLREEFARERAGERARRIPANVAAWLATQPQPQQK